MPESVNDELQDAAIRHQQHIIALGGHQSKKVITFMNKEVFPQTAKIIKNGLDRARTVRMVKKMAKAYGKVIDKGYKQINLFTQEDLKDIAEAEMAWQLKQFDKAMPIALEFELPAVGMINEVVNKTPVAGEVLTVAFKNQSQRAKRLFTRDIGVGLANGETNKEIVERVIGTKAFKFKDGTTQTVRNEADALVRTAVNNTSTKAREATYIANKKFIERVKYVATLDARTTDICASLDGQVFRLGDGPRPPQHFRCRSTTVPVVKSFKELGLPLKEVNPGIRAALNGAVPQKTTYYQWLKRQPKGVVDEALGKTKGRLFREGKLDSLTATKTGLRNLQGNSLTLDQVKQKAGLTEADIKVKRKK